MQFISCMRRMEHVVVQMDLDSINERVAIRECIARGDIEAALSKTNDIDTQARSRSGDRLSSFSSCLAVLVFRIFAFRGDRFWIQTSSYYYDSCSTSSSTLLYRKIFQRHCSLRGTGWRHLARRMYVISSDMHRRLSLTLPSRTAGILARAGIDYVPSCLS